MCDFWPAAGFLADLGPVRRGGELSGSPAASSLEVSPAFEKERQGEVAIKSFPGNLRFDHRTVAQ